MRLAEFFKAVQSFLQNVQRGAVADADGLVIAEGDAGDGRDLVAFQKLVAQIQGGESQPCLLYTSAPMFAQHRHLAPSLLRQNRQDA